MNSHCTFFSILWNDWILNWWNEYVSVVCWCPIRLSHTQRYTQTRTQRMDIAKSISSDPETYSTKVDHTYIIINLMRMRRHNEEYAGRQLMKLIMKKTKKFMWQKTPIYENRPMEPVFIIVKWYEFVFSLVGSVLGCVVCVRFPVKIVIMFAKYVSLSFERRIIGDRKWMLFLLVLVSIYWFWNFKKT